MASGYDISASVASAAKSGAYGSFSQTDNSVNTAYSAAAPVSKWLWIAGGLAAAALVLWFLNRKGGK